MRPSRSVPALAALVIALALWTACSKKAGSPVSPAAPACSVSPTSLDFGSVETGSVSATRSFAVTNSGGGKLSGTISESCPDFELASGEGAYDLGAGETHTVAVRFHPMSAGSKSCAVSTGCAQGVTLVGAGSPGPCTLTPATLDFGSVTVGQSADKTLRLLNSGSGTLSGTLTESCPEFAIVGQASYTLASGQTATFTIRFSPTQASGQTCTIATGAPGCPQVSCTGTGITANPACQVDVTGISFPQVALGQRDDGTFRLTNVGTGTLTGTVTEDCPDFSIAGQASYSLAPNQSQDFIVRFAPTQLGGQYCTVRVGAGCPALECWGSGVTGCDYQPSAFDFGYVLPGQLICGLSLTVTNNTSDYQEAVLNAGMSGAGGAGYITVDGARPPVLYGLNAGQSRTFALCWNTQYTTPCDTILATGLVSSDACPSAAGVQLRGVITKGCACSVAPTSLDFGNVIVGDTSPPQTVTINHQSGIKGLTGVIRVVSGDFVADPVYGCCPAGYCAVSTAKSIWFRPTRLGPQTGKIVVENLVGCFGSEARTVCDTVTVTGVGVTAVTGK